MKYFITVLIILFFSCNDEKNLKTFLRTADIPISSAIDIKTVHTDSGLVSSKLNSPKMLNFSNSNFPYFEFPEKIEVILLHTENHINAHMPRHMNVHIQTI